VSLLNSDQYYNRLLRPLGEVIIGMERRGVPFDLPAATVLLEKVKEDEARVRWQLSEWCSEIDFIGPEMPPNWGSWQQLQLVLYTPLGLNLPPAMYWKKGATGWVETDDGDYIVDPDRWNPDGNTEGEYKTDDKALEWLGWKHPEHKSGLDLIRALRWVTRVRAYLEKWISLCLFHPTRKWWFLHPSFGLSNDNAKSTGTRTGRFACSNPNLMQVPQDPPEEGYTGPDAHLAGLEYPLRRLFAAPPGYKWVVVDYSQLEIVVLAHVCSRLFGSDGLVQRVAPGAVDMHSATAKYVFGEVLGDPLVQGIPVELIKQLAKSKRETVKAVRYGLNYGKGDLGFGDTLFLESGEALGRERASQVIQGLLEFDPEIAQYQRWVREFITDNRGIASLGGRWQPLPDAGANTRGLRNRAYRQALNYPMQSGGQEITVAAMIAAHQDQVLAELGAEMVLQVHDELCWLAPEENDKLVKERALFLMTNTTKLDAHLSGSGGTGYSWGEAK
jgi:DNA polymerase I-like protein with 3'-5' exonuclease and polymerase domains